MIVSKAEINVYIYFFLSSEPYCLKKNQKKLNSAFEANTATSSLIMTLFSDFGPLCILQFTKVSRIVTTLSSLIFFRFFFNQTLEARDGEKISV